MANIAKKALFAIPTLLIGGLFLRITSIFDEGPLKGLKNFGGNFMLQGARILSNTLGPFLRKFSFNIIRNISSSVGNFFNIFGRSAGQMSSKFIKGAGIGILKNTRKIFGTIFKRLPIINTVLSIASAFSRFKARDYVGGFIDIASGLSYYIPHVGPAISLAIDLFSAARDMKLGGPKMASKGGINSSIHKFITEKLKNWIKNMLKKLPGFIKNPIYKILGITEERETDTGLNVNSYKQNNYIKPGETRAKINKPLEQFYSNKNLNKNINNQYGLRNSAPEIIKIKPNTNIRDSFTKNTQNNININERNKEIIERKNIKRTEENTRTLQQLAERQHKDICNLIDNLGDVFNNLKQTKESTNILLNNSNEERNIDTMIRDPAYVLRARAWDRIRNGYTLL